MQLINQNQMLGILILAVVMRATSLIYNELYLDLDPIWYSQSRTAIILALSDIGRIDLNSEVEAFYRTSVKHSILIWPFMDRGLVYVHLILKWLFGHTSYLSLQILQLVFDSILVFPIAAIGRRLGGNKAAMCSGLFYAVFIPQIWLATMPEYNVWLTYTFIILTWLMVIFIETFNQKAYGMAAVSAGAILAVGFIGAQMRSIAVLAPLGFAGWYWLSLCFQNRTLRVSVTNFRIIILTVLIGISLVVGSSLVNGLIRGETSPVRSTFGHSFWAGIGQFDNPFDVQNYDDSIVQFYTKNTGIKDTGNTGGIEYNEWLTKRGLEFVQKEPSLYLSMVARRGLMILFPNMPFTIVADMPAYSLQETEIERVKHRKSLQAEYGRLSPVTISKLVKSDPAYVVGLMFRTFLLFALPLGIISFLVLSLNRAIGMLALFPLGYTLVTLSLFYITPVVLIPVYTAILPVVVTGWWLLYERCRSLTYKKQTQRNSINS